MSVRTAFTSNEATAEPRKDRPPHHSPKEWPTVWREHTLYSEAVQGATRSYPLLPKNHNLTIMIVPHPAEDWYKIALVLGGFQSSTLLLPSPKPFHRLRV